MTDDTNPWAVDRPNAVEYLKREIRRREYFAKRGQRTLDEAGETVTLPLDIARLVLAAAQAGVHKGRGRGGIALTHSARNRRDGIFLWAKALKAELMKKNVPASTAEARARLLWKRFGIAELNQGMPAGEAEQRAAEEARKFALERYGLVMAVRSIKRGMASI
jgi:hypothetical protein